MATGFETSLSFNGMRRDKGKCFYSHHSVQAQWEKARVEYTQRKHEKRTHPLCCVPIHKPYYPLSLSPRIAHLRIFLLFFSQKDILQTYTTNTAGRSNILRLHTHTHIVTIIPYPFPKQNETPKKNNNGQLPLQTQKTPPTRPQTPNLLPAPAQPPFKTPTTTTNPPPPPPPPRTAILRQLPRRAPTPTTTPSRPPEFATESETRVRVRARGELLRYVPRRRCCAEARRSEG